MTIDEMRNKLDKFCEGFDLCIDGCPLRKPDDGSCRWNNLSDKSTEDCYHFLEGLIGKPDAQRENKGGRIMAGTFIICNNEDEIKSSKSRWGNATFELSTEDIVALMKGKTLATMVAGEYGVFIKMGGIRWTEVKNNGKVF